MNQDEKCHPNGLCFHGPEDHEGGACWKITQAQLEDQDTIDKFCGCIGPGNTRPFNHKLMVFMPATEIGDLMVTKICKGCGEAVNLRVEEILCMVCKDKPEHWKNEVSTIPQGNWIEHNITP